MDGYSEEGFKGYITFGKNKLPRSGSIVPSPMVYNCKNHTRANEVFVIVDCTKCNELRILESHDVHFPIST